MIRVIININRLTLVVRMRTLYTSSICGTLPHVRTYTNQRSLTSSVRNPTYIVCEHRMYYKQCGVVMETTKQLTDDYTDYAVNVQRPHKIGVRKPLYVTDKNGKTTLDEHGKKIRVYTVDDDGKKTYKYQFDEMIHVTLNWSNCTFADVIENADANVIVKLQRVRDDGIDHVRSLDGTTVDVRELLSAKSNGISAISKHINKLINNGDMDGLDALEKIIMEKLKNARKS